MQTEQPTVKFRRGETSPEHPGLVFKRYSRGKEIWVTPESLVASRNSARESNKRWGAKPEAKEYRKSWRRAYNHSPKNATYRAAYKKTEEFKAKQKELYKTDPRIRERNRRYAASEAAKQMRKEYEQTEAAKARRVEYRKRQRQNPIFKMIHNLRGRIATAIKLRGVRKASKSRQLIGCSFDFFRGWIESQFKPGMTWDNYGPVWHIDHKEPISKFNLLNESEQKAAFNYRNCQPMFAEENMKKSDRIEGFLFRGRDIRPTNFQPSNN